MTRRALKIYEDSIQDCWFSLELGLIRLAIKWLRLAPWSGLMLAEDAIMMFVQKPIFAAINPAPTPY